MCRVIACHQCRRLSNAAERDHSWKVNKLYDCKLCSVAKSVCGGSSQTKLFCSYESTWNLCLTSSDFKIDFNAVKNLCFHFRALKNGFPPLYNGWIFTRSIFLKEHHIIIWVSVLHSSRLLDIICKGCFRANVCANRDAGKWMLQYSPEWLHYLNVSPRAHSHSSLCKISNGRLERWKAIIRFYASFFTSIRFCVPLKSQQHFLLVRVIFMFIFQAPTSKIFGSVHSWKDLQEIHFVDSFIDLISMYHIQKKQHSSMWFTHLSLFYMKRTLSSFFRRRDEKTWYAVKVFWLLFAR